MRCSGKIVKCTDKSCKQYNKHYTCAGHNLHLGDRVQQKDTKWTGYVYDANPFGSKRSVFVMWDSPHHDEGELRTGKLFMGHSACVNIEKIDGPRVQNVSNK